MAESLLYLIVFLVQKTKKIGKVTEFHKKKFKHLDVIEEKLMGGANLAPPMANRVKRDSATL